ERVPELSFRDLGAFAPDFGAPGEGRYMIDRYLRERGDANIRSNADLIAKATFYDDPNFPDRRRARENAQLARAIDTSVRLQNRFAFQTMMLQCMQEQQLDVLVAPTASVPPRKLTAPPEPMVNGRSPVGWSFIGQQGFPVKTVPAGFTTEVWERMREDDGTRIESPGRAKHKLGVGIIAHRFDENLPSRDRDAFE